MKPFNQCFNLMKLYKTLIICLFFFAFSNTGKAQFFYDCVDTSRVNPYYICGDPTYRPVCGCNGVTYRNECSAYFAGGVNYHNNGTCENFGFDILQNPVLYYLTLSVYTSKSDRVLLQVWNLFGKIEYEDYFVGYEASVTEKIIDTYNWPRGMYIVVVNVNGEQQTKKLVKVSAE